MATPPITGWVLSQFSDKSAAGRRISEKYVAEGKEGKEGGHQQEYHQGPDMDSGILGNERFVDRVLGPKRSMLKF